MNAADLDAAIEAGFAIIKARIPQLDEADKAIYRIAFVEGVQHGIEEIKQSFAEVK